MSGIKAILDDFSEFCITPRDIVAEDDIVFCHCESKGMHKIGGNYGQDYAFTFYFTPDSSDEITYVKEFVDSLYSMNFFKGVHKKRKAIKLAQASETANLKLSPKL